MTFVASLGELPPGAFVVRADSPAEAWIVWRDRLLQWSPGGYTAVAPIRPAETVRVLTPRSVVRTFAEGYAPTVHPSAAP